MISRSLKRKVIRLLLSVVSMVLLFSAVNIVTFSNPTGRGTRQTAQPKTVRHQEETNTIGSSNDIVPENKEEQELQYRACDEVRSGYCVLRDIWKATEKIDTKVKEGITLTTQGTPGFLHHLTEICRRWQGPISVAIYAPGRDFKNFLQEAALLRHCGGDCVKRWVTWHAIFDLAHLPPTHLLGNTALRVVPDCGKTTFSNTTTNVTTYIEEQNLPYPINVARNVARLTAQTQYVLPTDIELYPSRAITTPFLQMLQKEPSTNGRQVYVLPVFEVRNGIQVPENKSHLQELFKKNKALVFHRYMCNVCHRIPNFTEWLRLPWEKDSSLRVFLSVKRHRGMRRGDYGLTLWEPFFIGTNNDPLFDERLTWNGRQNKMQLEYELCLMDYDFKILDGAFLVHSPGIKHRNVREEENRLEFVKSNQKAFRQIEKELKQKYGKKWSCARPDGHAGFQGKWRVKKAKDIK